MTLVSTLIVAAVCLALGLFLAFLPMRLLLYAMAKKMAARTQARDAPDRRDTPV